MTRRLTERIIGALIILFLLAYVGYQARMYFAKPLSTDTVYEYTVSRSLAVEGIAVRDEIALERMATGAEYYPLEDASRVAVGETVAELSRGNSANQGTRRIRELRTEIDRLEEAQSIPVNYSNTETYNRDVKTRLGNLSQMASSGRFEEIDEMRQSITLNINKKQISNGKAESFAERINQLQAKLQQMESSQTLNEGESVRVDRTGYFSKSVDGLESLLSVKGLSALSVDECLDVIRNSKSGSARNVGKLVLSENWVYAAPIPAHNLEWIKTGQRVQVEFEQIRQSVPATVSKIIDQKGSEEAIVLLACNQMNEELINLRTCGATIVFKQYTGLRINAADLRFRQRPDGTTERGVYILRNNQQVYFRLVDAIYEEPGFVLSRTYYSTEEYLEPQRQERRHQKQQAADEPPDLTLEQQEKADEQGAARQEEEYKRYVILFDQVITKGNDLQSRAEESSQSSSGASSGAESGQSSEESAQ